MLNFVTLAWRALESRNVTNADKFLVLAERLLDATARCLGEPRGPKFPMRKRKASVLSEVHGRVRGVPVYEPEHVGMRIGKEQSRAMSDPGMQYDGMYWHYIDKWIFALTRVGMMRQRLAMALLKEQSGEKCSADAAPTAPGSSSCAPEGAGAPGPALSHLHQAKYLLSRAVDFTKEVHAHFVSREGSNRALGLYWKLNVDMSLIRGRETTGPNGDALSGCCVYGVLNNAVGRLNSSSTSSSSGGIV